MKYETEETEFGTNIKKIDEDGKIYYIPLDSANSDYQAYLNKDNPDWKKENTTPVL